MKKNIGQIMALIQTLQPGDHFYTSEKPNIVTRYADLYKRKVSTERVISLQSYLSEEPKIIKLTKVTIL